MQPIDLPLQLLKAGLNRVADLGGGGGALLLDGQDDAVVSVDLGVHIRVVIRKFNGGHVVQPNLLQVLQIHGKQQQIFEFLHLGDLIAHLDQILLAVLLDIARGHAEVLGGQHGGNHFHGNYAVQLGLFKGLLALFVEFLARLAQFLLGVRNFLVSGGQAVFELLLGRFQLVFLLVELKPLFHLGRAFIECCESGLHLGPPLADLGELGIDGLKLSGFFGGHIAQLLIERIQFGLQRGHLPVALGNFALQLSLLSPECVEVRPAFARIAVQQLIQGGLGLIHRLLGLALLGVQGFQLGLGRVQLGLIFLGNTLLLGERLDGFLQTGLLGLGRLDLIVQFCQFALGVAQRLLGLLKFALGRGQLALLALDPSVNFRGVGVGVGLDHLLPLVFQRLDFLFQAGNLARAAVPLALRPGNRLPGRGLLSRKGLKGLLDRSQIILRLLQLMLLLL